MARMNGIDGDGEDLENKNRVAAAWRRYFVVSVTLVSVMSRDVEFKFFRLESLHSNFG